jgi:aminoglycoside phosphotransferase family enzyme/predicted kinase
MTIPEAQQSVAALLRGLAGRDPIETHISAVFCGPDTVWKLRKAVRLDFLDFSTLAERHRTALRELALNGAHAPGLYRDVVAVTRGADGRLALGGAGTPVEWVLRMARVPAADFLESMPPERIAAMADALGDAVAAYHAGLAPAAGDPAAAMAETLRGNVRSARSAALPEAAVTDWGAAMQIVLTRLAEWMRRRGRAGFVRRAHGDLHLGNMALWRGHPVAFDALEFDEALATIDLGYDLAFLLMDLDVRVGRPAANRVLNRYVARTGDAGLLAGLAAFLSMRALIRAHVAARSSRLPEALAYLARAGSFLEPSPPRLIAIGGLPGTGKSTLARALAPELGLAPGALVLRSDEIRKRQHGVAPETRLPPSGYTKAANKAVAAELVACAAAAIAAGHTVIADATFLAPLQRAAIAQAAGHARFHGVWLVAPHDVLEARVAARRGDASDADVALLRRMAAAGAVPKDWLAVNATDRDAALAAIRADL